MTLHRLRARVGTDATAVIVTVPEAAAARLVWGSDSTDGLPPHLTVAYPLPPTAATESWRRLLAEALAGVPAFGVVLDRLGHFEDLAYLAPRDPAPLEALVEAVGAVFPGFPMYGGAFERFIPHLTLGAGGNPDREAAVQRLLPLAGGAGVELWAHTRRRWRRVCELPLAAGAR